jgi:PST family polysaccharide transporter
MTLVIFGAKWLPAVPVVQWMALAGVLRIVVGSGYPLFRGLGRPDYELFMGVIQLALLVPLTIVFTARWSFVGTAGAVVAAEAALLLVWWFLLKKLVDVGPSAVIKLALPACAAAALMAAAQLGVLRVMRDQPAIAQLVVSCGVALVVYVGFFWVGWRTWGWRSIEVVLSAVRAGGRKAATPRVSSDLGVLAGEVGTDKS